MSMSTPQSEHLIVGRKLIGLSVAAMAACARYSFSSVENVQGDSGSGDALVDAGGMKSQKSVRNEGKGWTTWVRPRQRD
jgi:hypothetical protein